jgi:CubicO group peptidase (beta-lactamase class C family)
MRINLTSVFIVVLIFVFQPAFSQTMDKQKLDAYFQALDANQKFMGNVAISQNGKIIYTNSIGFADVDAQIKLQENTKFRIGSITKTFTSTLTFLAIEEGKLSLSTTLDTFFPTIENADKITISNLLNHRSGIFNLTDNENYLEWNTKKHSREELIKIITATKNDFEPNEKAEYSNSNYVLLSFILEDVYKKSYSELIEEKITTPFDLQNTYIGKHANTENKEAYSYSFAGKWNKSTETDLSVPMGAGAIVSTASDLIKFAENLFAAKIVSSKSLEQMKTIEDDYGMGLFQIPFYDKKSFGHTGGIDGFSSMFGYFPNEKASFVILSNGVTNYSTNDVAIILLSAVFDKTYEIPVFSNYEASLEELNQYVGTYASEQIPLKIEISVENEMLFAQATGQSEFPLDATEKDKFEFKQAGISLEFNPKENTMILKQGGGTFLFKKE